MVEPHAVLEVSDGILNLGVATMIGLQFQGVPVPISDEAVISVPLRPRHLYSHHLGNHAGREAESGGTIPDMVAHRADAGASVLMPDDSAKACE